MIPIKDDVPSRTTPFVTIAILVLNVLVFSYELVLSQAELQEFVYRTAAIPYEIISLDDQAPTSMVPIPFTLFTAMFVHGDILHLAGNMLFLWIFSDNIEDVFGHWIFPIFYIATGFIASMTHILMNSGSTIPMIGASGAVAGVLGAYFVLFPRANVMSLVFLFFFVTVVRIPAVVFLGLWFMFQVLSSAGGGGIAWYAHIGGFVSGALLVLVFRPRALTRARR